ncbi:MAG: hypothetical protein SGJ11_02450 [Phycisphaerae bacterium]|nr:hypothetical protein [Phycisphaerae bacterium]
MDPVAALIHVGIGALLAAIVAFAGRGLRRADPAVTVGLALAFALGWNFVTQEGFPAWPLAAKWHSILIVAGGLGLLAAIDGLIAERCSKFAYRIVANTILAAALVGFALRLPDADMPGIQFIAMGTLPFVLVPLAGLAVRERRFSVPAAISFCFAGLAGLCLEGGFAKLAVLCGSLGAALGGIALLGLRWPVGLGVGGLAAALGLLVSFAAAGAAYYEGQFPVWIWAMPVLALLLMLVASSNKLAGKQKLAAVLRVALPAALALARVGMAIAMGGGQTASESTTEYEIDYGG